MVIHVGHHSYRRVVDDYVHSLERAIDQMHALDWGGSGLVHLATRTCSWIRARDVGSVRLFAPDRGLTGYPECVQSTSLYEVKTRWNGRPQPRSCRGRDLR